MRESLQAISSITAAIALSCCLLLFVCVRAFPSTLFGGRLAHFELKLLMYWNASETLAAVSNLVYRVDAAAARGLDDGTLQVSALCQAQGFLMQFGYMSAFLWVLVLAVHAFLVAVRNQRHASKFELVYVALALMAPAGHAAIILELGYFAPTDLWCWISSERHALAQWLHFYIPLGAIVLLTLALRFATWRTLKRRAAIEGETGMESATMHVRSSVPITSGGVSSTGSRSSSSSSSPIARALARWVWTQKTWMGLFLLLRIPAVVHRAYEQLGPSQPGGVAESQTLAVLHAIASPLQGVLPLLIFLLNGRMSRSLKQRWRAWIGNGTTVVPPLPGSVAVGTASSGAGYRSLMEHEASSPNTISAAARGGGNLESVFPPAVWKRIGSAAAEAIMPPTRFHAFPMHAPLAPTAQQLPSPTPAAASSSSSPYQHPHAPAPAPGDSVSSLRIFSGSWNMGNAAPPLDPSHPDWDASNVLSSHASQSLSSWLPSGAAASAYDLLVIGVQECEYDTVLGRGSWARALCGWNDTRNFVPTAREHWLDVVCNVVNRGRDAIHPPSVASAAPTDLRPFRVVGEASLGHIRLCVLVHPRLLPLVSSVVSSSEGSGLGNLWVNKGGVGVSLRVGPALRLAFVNTHLAALDGFKHDRNEDVVQIMARLKLRGETGAGEDGAASGQQQQHHSASSSNDSLHTSCVCCSELDPLQSFDFALFLGDLNYRLVLPPSTEAALHAPSAKALRKLRLAEAKRHVAAAFRAGDLAALRPMDELSRLMDRSKLFAGWTEAPLQFYPTYKYKITGHKMKARRHGKASKQQTHSLSADQYADVRVDGSSSSSSSASPPAASPTSFRAASHDPDLYGSKRVPAWCDRVLYRLSPAYSPQSVRVEEYRDVLSVDSSDHKPVRAVFALDFGLSSVGAAGSAMLSGANGLGSAGSASLSGSNGSVSALDEEQKDVMGDSRRGSSAGSGPSAHSTQSALSPPRRRKRTDSDQAESTLTAGASINAGTVGAASPPPRDYSRSSASASSSSSLSAPIGRTSADDFLASNPGALGLISPAILRLLSSPLGQSSHRFRLAFSSVCAYDVLDSYGTPVLEPFVSFAGEVLCGGSSASASECARFHTCVARPVAGSSAALLSLARSLLSARAACADKRAQPYSLYQSSPTALECRCIRVAEWDAESVLGSGVSGVALNVSAPSARDIPLIVTPRKLTFAQVAQSTVQLILKDARHLGSDADYIGAACVALKDAVVTTASGAEPVFFIAPIIAQSRYRGFISGRLSVEAMQQ